MKRKAGIIRTRFSYANFSLAQGLHGQLFGSRLFRIWAHGELTARLARSRAFIIRP